MNAVMEAILSRRSIRKFKDDPIPDEVLQDVAKAALHAPSGMGKKTWHFVVLTNPDLIAQLAEAIRQELGRDQYDMYKPVALVIPSNLRDNPHGKEDNACALQNIFLAAHSYGVGSVWINQLQGICDTERIRPILDRIGVPSDHVVYGMAALGYPAIIGMYRKGGEVTFVK